MLENLRIRLARMLVPVKRMYAGARPSRLTLNWQASTTSGDAELRASHAALRDRSRALCRDASFAKRARDLVVNNVIGSGMGMQAQVKTARDGIDLKSVNDDIEDAWEQWKRADHFHTAGTMHFNDFERACMAQVFEAGEVIVRMHNRRFGESLIPLGLELIESERLADQIMQPMPGVLGNYRQGIEVDGFERPIAYWIRNRTPNDLRISGPLQDGVFRVPASEIFHIRLAERIPQARGVPWMHAVILKLNDMSEYTAAELTAARSSANYFATLETADDDALGAEEQEDGSRQLEIQPSMILKTFAGEKLNFHSPNRPNSAMDAFMRHMLREMAAGLSIPYETLSQDYSQSNYSSSRLSLIDARDHWQARQQWWIRTFREPLHRKWLETAVMARAISSIKLETFLADRARFEAVRFKPRGWTWIDPTKEVDAFKEAIKGGMTTITDVIAMTGNGMDIEDVIDTRKRELAMFEEAGIDVDTTVPEEAQPVPEPAVPAQQDQPPQDQQEQDGSAEDQSARVLRLGRM